MFRGFRNALALKLLKFLMTPEVMRHIDKTLAANFDHRTDMRPDAR